MKPPRENKAHHTIRNNNPYLDGYALTIDEMKKLLERYDEVKDDEDFSGYYNFIEYYLSYYKKEAVNVYGNNKR